MQYLLFHPASGGPGHLNREMNSRESTISGPLFESCLPSTYFEWHVVWRSENTASARYPGHQANEQRSGTMGVPLGCRMANQRRRNASWNDQGN